MPACLLCYVKQALSQAKVDSDLQQGTFYDGYNLYLFILVRRIFDIQYHIGDGDVFPYTTYIEPKKSCHMNAKISRERAKGQTFFPGNCLVM